MSKKTGYSIIVILSIILIVGGIYQCINPRSIITEVSKSIEGIPLTIESMDLILTKVDEKEYLNRDQMIKKGKNFVRHFVHNEECKSGCKEYHEDTYEMKTSFDRLDKKIDIIGETVGIPYDISLHNRKDQIYHLYYQMNISLLEQKDKLQQLQEYLNKTSRRWAEEVKTSVQLTGNIKGKLTHQEKQAYASQILDELNAYYKKDYTITISEEEDIYYGYLRYLKEYEENEKGNKFNVIVKFIFDPTINQTQLIFKLPSKI